MKILLGISGGVDSFTSAEFLLKQGYDITLLTFNVWHKDKKTDNSTQIKIAEYLKTELIICDLSELFYNKIVCNFIESYMIGKTPNPCVDCNRDIKFKILYETAKKNNCDLISTGHYAKVENKDGRFFIKEADDKTKDQSYFLWKLPQEYLKKIIFPLGEMKKTDIKDYYKKEHSNGPTVLQESENLCFLDGKSYKDIICESKKEELSKLNNGNFIYKGNIVGEHKGYPFYIIGQRRGLVPLGFPAYVIKIDPQKNLVYIGGEEDLLCDKIIVGNLNFQKYDKIYDGYECLVRIRYKDKKYKCKISFIESNKILVTLCEKAKEITPGQSAVFYENEDLIFGGIIE